MLLLSSSSPPLLLSPSSYFISFLLLLFLLIILFLFRLHVILSVASLPYTLCLFFFILFTLLHLPLSSPCCLLFSRLLSSPSYLAHCTPLPSSSNPKASYDYCFFLTISQHQDAPPFPSSSSSTVQTLLGSLNY